MKRHFFKKIEGFITFLNLVKDLGIWIMIPTPLKSLKMELPNQSYDEKSECLSKCMRQEESKFTMIKL